MLRIGIFRSKLVVLALLGTFSFLMLPVPGLAQAKMGSMTGFVFGADKTTPVENAVVRVRNVVDGREYRGTPSNKTGLYSVKNLPEGRYLLGISGAEGDYNFDYQIMIKGGEIAKLAVALTPMPASKTQNEEGTKKKAFFLTPLGIAVLVAAGGLLIYGGLQLVSEGQTSTTIK